MKYIIIEISNPKRLLTNHPRELFPTQKAAAKRAPKRAAKRVPSMAVYSMPSRPHIMPIRQHVWTENSNSCPQAASLNSPRDETGNGVGRC